jgi:hypothetical protein
VVENLKFDRDSTPEAEGTLLGKAATAAGVAWIVLLIYLAQNWLSGRGAVPDFRFLRNRDQVGRVLWAAVVTLPIALTAYLGGTPMRSKVLDGHFVLQRSRYLLSPLTWWQFFPLWPAFGAAIWALVWGISRLGQVSTDSPGWMLVVSLVTALIAFVMFGSTLSVSECRLEPDGIRTSTMRFTEWDNLDRILDTPGGLIIFDRRIPGKPRARIYRSNKSARWALQAALAGRELTFEEGIYRAPIVSVVTSVALACVTLVIVIGARTWLGWQPMWVTLVGIVTGSLLTVVLDWLRGEFGGTYTGLPKISDM